MRLGRVAGIDLFLHWTWFVVAVLEIGAGKAAILPSSGALWNIWPCFSLCFCTNSVTRWPAGR